MVVADDGERLGIEAGVGEYIGTRCCDDLRGAEADPRSASPGDGNGHILEGAAGGARRWGRRHNWRNQHHWAVGETRALAWAPIYLTHPGVYYKL